MPVARPLASRMIHGSLRFSSPSASIALLLRYCSERVNCRNTGLFGRHLVELLARERLLVVRELIGRPAAEVEHPLAGPGRLGLGADQLERLLARVDAVEAQLERPVGALLLEVRVVVDHPGNHRPAAQVDAPRVRTRQPRDVLVGADRDDAVAAHGHGLRDRELVVNGDDLSVRQDRVRGRACRAGALRGGGRLLLCADQDRSSYEPGCQEHVHPSFHGRFSIN